VAGDCVVDCSVGEVVVAEEVGGQPELACLSMHVVVAGVQQQHQGGERARMDDTAREPILAVAFASTAAASSVELFTWNDAQSSSSSSSSSTPSLPPSFSQLHQRPVTHHIHSFPNECSMLAAVRNQSPQPLSIQPPRNLTSSPQALRHFLSCDPHVIITYVTPSFLPTTPPSSLQLCDIPLQGWTAQPLRTWCCAGRSWECRAGAAWAGAAARTASSGRGVLRLWRWRCAVRACALWLERHTECRCWGGCRWRWGWKRGVCRHLILQPMFSYF
jgi:hypothetical protein